MIALSQAKPAEAQTQSSTSLVRIQTKDYELTVEVVDPTGAAIPNAEISTLNETAQDSFEASTDEMGRATLSLQSNSSYSIKITVPGFAARTIQHLQAPFAKLVTVRMELGWMGEIVEVPAFSLNLRALQRHHRVALFPRLFQ